MKDYTNVKPETAKREEYPPTLSFPETGGEGVYQAVEVKLDVHTTYGPKTVVQVVDRQGKKWSIFWPGKLPLPPVATPFKFGRKDKKSFFLSVPETEAEMRAIWPLP